MVILKVIGIVVSVLVVFNLIMVLAFHRGLKYTDELQEEMF